MKSLKLVVGLASIVTLFLTLTPIAYGATITLRPNPNATPQMLATNVQGLSCATPHTDAALAGTPFFEMPQIAEEHGDKGNSVVEIDLLPNGDTQPLRARAIQWKLRLGPFRFSDGPHDQIPARNAQLRRDLGVVLVRSGLLEPYSSIVDLEGAL